MGKKSSPVLSGHYELSREMRDATNGRYPAFTVWENVAGAFSSNDRLDFATMLSAFTGADGFSASLVDGHTPEWCEGDALIPLGDCWTPVLGEPAPSYSAASVFVVADFTNQRAELLFKPRTVLPFSCDWRSGRAWPPPPGGVPAQTGRQVPIVRPFFPSADANYGTGRRSERILRQLRTRRRTVPNSACQCNGAVFVLVRE